MTEGFKTFYFQPLRLWRLLDLTILRTAILSSRTKTEVCKNTNPKIIKLEDILLLVKLSFIFFINLFKIIQLLTTCFQEKLV